MSIDMPVDDDVPAKPGSVRLPPPGALNLVLAVVIVATLLASLALAARQTSWLAVVGFGVVFSFVFLPLYSLVHEAEHRTFHGVGWLNDAAGIVLAAFFPGPFSFLRACHLGHHRRNRSDAEMFDLYYPHDSVWRKRVNFYSLYLGAFWLSVPLATLLLIVAPRALQSQLIQDAPAAAAMVNGIQPRYVQRIRWEAVGVVVLHALLIWALHVPLVTYALFYALAGLNWSSQQYITHAHSPRNAVDGAHNLRAHPLYAGLLLNFNWHLAHHQHPGVPWLYLSRFDDPTRVRPGYLRAFIHFWRGPLPVPRVGS